MVEFPEGLRTILGSMFSVKNGNQKEKPMEHALETVLALTEYEDISGLTSI